MTLGDAQKVSVQSPQPVTQWELDVRFVEGLYSQLETLLMLLPFVRSADNPLYLLTPSDIHLLPLSLLSVYPLLFGIFLIMNTRDATRAVSNNRDETIRATLPAKPTVIQGERPQHFT